MAAAVAGAGLLGSGAAVAASGTSATSAASASAPLSGTGLAAFEADLAGKLGVSVSTLQGALEQAETDRVQQLQNDGLITAAAAQKLEQQIQAGGGLRMLARLAGAPPGGLSLLQKASQYLGLPVSQIRTDLRNGQSLDAIANGQAGKSASGLKAALVAAEQAALQQKVTAGTITATQEQTRLTRFEKHLGAMLSKAGFGGRRHSWRAGWPRHDRGASVGSSAGGGSISSGSSGSTAAGTSSSSSSG